MKVKTAVIKLICLLKILSATARTVWLPILRRAAGCLKRGSRKTCLFLKNNVVTVFVFTALLGGIIGNAGTDWAKNLPVVKHLFPPAPANAEAIIASSADYQKLLAAETKLRQRYVKLQEKVRRYPDDDDFKQELAEVQQEWQTARNHVQQFQNDVVQLAQTFRHAAPDTRRLRQARAYFQQGRLDKARAVLNGETLLSEQKQLLADKQRLSAQTAENKKRLSHNGQEWLLKAQLTAMDYSLKEQRVPAARAAFETALRAERSAETLFQYAYFLQQNKYYREAEAYYRQAWHAYAQMRDDNGDAYRENTAKTLNNLALLLAHDPFRHREAETLYLQAAERYRTLAQNRPAAFEPDLAATLNNCAVLIAKDPARWRQAETLYREALSLRRRLAENPAFAGDAAETLNNLAALLAKDPKRRRETEALFRETVAAYVRLSEKRPEYFVPRLAAVRNNLAVFTVQQPNRRAEAETLFRQALDGYRELAQHTPGVFLPELTGITNNLAIIAAQDPARQHEAEKLFREVLANYRTLSARTPEVFAHETASAQSNLAMLLGGDPARREEAEQLFRQALHAYRRLAVPTVPKCFKPILPTP
nr:tetratricopeptide repeat protein [Conchiformibius kuhniae]